MFSEIITAIILGIIQGLTEFIPVSSSGHLLLTTELLNLTNSSFSFELALNLGTLLALIGYFWRDILAIIKMLKKPKTQGLPAKIVVATIPAVIIGALALPLVSTVLRSPMIGFSQALAFIPDTSRSGITIIAGRLTGLSHKQAARFSFPMAIPIVTLALLKLLLDFNTQDMASGVLALIVGIITSFLVGLAAIHFMLKFLEKYGLKSFGYYRIIIGLVVLFILINRGVI